MSTVYDALKKAEAERNKAAGVENKSPEGDTSFSGGGMPESTKIILLLVAVVLVFAFTLYRINGLLFANNKPAAVKTAASSPAAAAPAVPQAALDPYVLGGVINAGENSMAIINGRLLKVDASIDDLVLKKISPKEVELLNSKTGNTVILKIK